MARAVLLVAVALVAAEFAHAIFGVGSDRLFDDFLYDAIDLIAAGLCLARGVTRRDDRAAWLLIGTGLLAWALGDISWSFILSDEASTPSVADGLYLAFYPCALIGVLLLARKHLLVRSWAVRMDGVIAGLGLAAVVVDLLLGPALAVDGSTGEVATNLAYVIGDVVLVGLVGAMTITGGRGSGAPWFVLGAGLLIAAVGDAVYLLQAANGTYGDGDVLDVLWLVAVLLMGWAAWHSSREAKPTVPSASRSRVVPVGVGAAAVAILLVDHFDRASGLAAGLAAATLLAVLGRLMLTARETDSLLRATRQDAMTDPLTGLANRRALLDDLDQACHAAGGATSALVVFDLNGFKHYNDSFGHPAGDALLVRIGHRLRDAEHGGTAYRLGGDEFCVLAPADNGQAPSVVARSLAALNEHGEGFSITSAHGFAIVPKETDDPGEAMRIADRRMYAHKHSLSGGEEVFTREALRSVEQGHPDLVGHQDRVAALARAACRALGMTTEEIDVTVRAAELHDIGKVAIPDQILSKPDALTEEEWEFVRRHTIVGERIVSATPSLAPVGRIIRSSHERWDGAGYPDGLAGEKIPLGARVLAVCDAYDVITTGRVYKAAMKPDQAIVELVRHSGTQFDPAVVEKFVWHVYPSAGREKIPASTDEPLPQSSS